MRALQQQLGSSSCQQTARVNVPSVACRHAAASSGRARGGGRASSSSSSSSSRRACVQVRATAATGPPAEGMKTIVQKTLPGDVPFPWSEKDPYRLPVSIDRIQKMLITLGWEKPWVEQIVDRIMKGSLKTTEERAQGVIDALAAVGLKQDEICNMASISVVLLGLNPETRIAPVVDYLRARGVEAGALPELLLQHPRIFEYKATPEGVNLAKGAARIQVDVLPLPDGQKATAVNYFRTNTQWLESPVSPLPPTQL